MMSETIKLSPVVEPKVDVEPTGEWQLVKRKQKKNAKLSKEAKVEADSTPSSQSNKPWKRWRDSQKKNETSSEDPSPKIDLDKDFPPLSRASNSQAVTWNKEYPGKESLQPGDQTGKLVPGDKKVQSALVVPQEPEREPAAEVCTQPEARDRPQGSADEEFISMEELQEELCRLLRRKRSSHKTMEWLQANVDEDDLSSHEFLEILVVCLCKSELVLGDIPHVRARSVLRQTPLLRFFVKDQEKQMTMLRVLGEVMTRMNHPDGLLNMILDIFVDEDIVQEGTFIRWKNFEDQRGNHELLSSVTKFFSYLTRA